MLFGCVLVAIIEITSAESLPLMKLIDNYNENCKLCSSIKMNAFALFTHQNV